MFKLVGNLFTISIPLSIFLLLYPIAGYSPLSDMHRHILILNSINICPHINNLNLVHIFIAYGEPYKEILLWPIKATLISVSVKFGGVSICAPMKDFHDYQEVTELAKFPARGVLHKDSVGSPIPTVPKSGTP